MPSSSESARNGLATWRTRLAEERRLKLMELEHYRSYATTEERDGKTYTVVRIPDRYDFTQKPRVLDAQVRGPKRKQAAW